MRRGLSTMGRAYTLAELLIVISIFALLLAIGIPAFSSAIKDSDEANAANQLRVALSIARDVAVQSTGQDDSAAVFFYTPGPDGKGRTSIVPYVRVGTLRQPRTYGAGDISAAYNEGKNVVPRDVFAPAPGAKAVQMPKGWMVRAFAAPGTLETANAASDPYRTGWYRGDVMGRVHYKPESQGNWVFPETGFFRSTQETTAGSATERAFDGRNRSTFMVRFRAGTGAMAVADQRLVLVIDASPDGTFRETVAPFSALPPSYPNRLDRSEDPAEFVRRRLTSDLNGDRVRNREDVLAAQRLFGLSIEDQVASSDSVLARPITQVALYRESDLAAYLGAARLNASTGTIYGGPALEAPTEPRIDTSLFSSNVMVDQLSERINAWIEGRRPALSGAGQVAPTTTSRIFTFGTYLGQTIEYDAPEESQ